MSHRIDRLNEFIQREISVLVQREIRDPRVKFVTISRVDVSKDLGYAEVFFSVLGSETEARDSLAGLTHCSGFFRSHLAKALHTRTVPRLRFHVDEGPTNSERIETILREIKEGKPPAPIPDGETETNA